MRRCWMTWVRLYFSIWRVWSRCLNSVSNLRKSGWFFLRRCCWILNVILISLRIVGSWAW